MVSIPENIPKSGRRNSGEFPNRRQNSGELPRRGAACEKGRRAHVTGQPTTGWAGDPIMGCIDFGCLELVVTPFVLTPASHHLRLGILIYTSESLLPSW